MYNPKHHKLIHLQFRFIYKLWASSNKTFVDGDTCTSISRLQFPACIRTEHHRKHFHRSRSTVIEEQKWKESVLLVSFWFLSLEERHYIWYLFASIFKKSYKNVDDIFFILRVLVWQFEVMFHCNLIINYSVLIKNSLYKGCCFFKQQVFCKK